MGYVTRFADSSAPPKRVRVGVGGCWSADTILHRLDSILESTRWTVRLRGDTPDESEADSIHDSYSVEHSGFVEIVSLGDGLSRLAPITECEELDAVVISPLAFPAALADDDRTFEARRHLARFIRQLKPGGATIFAADDPASDIFSAIRLDCHRLGYAADGTCRLWRVDRCDSPAANFTNILSLTFGGDSGAYLKHSVTGEDPRIALAAMALVKVLGLAATKQGNPLNAVMAQFTASIA